MAQSASQQHPLAEPTFRLGPSEEEKFYPSRIEELLLQLSAEFFADKAEYLAAEAETWAQALSEKILARVRGTLHIPRYKLMAQVVVLQDLGQGAKISSKCLWDVAYDNWASCTFRNQSLVCCAMVFGVYAE